jgi:hypothetical protein
MSFVSNLMSSLMSGRKELGRVGSLFTTKGAHSIELFPVL